MRLTSFQVEKIREIFQVYFDKEDSLWLFGSRVFDDKKGGDIDLYTETNLDPSLIFKRKISFLSHLKSLVGDQKIDLVVRSLKENSSYL